MTPNRKSLLLLLLSIVAAGPALGAADVDRAKAYAKKNDCFKCHTPDKTKKGPSYKKIAEKYRSKADAESKMFTHLTTGQKVKLEDGTEEDHKALDKNEAAEIKNVISWIRELQ